MVQRARAGFRRAVDVLLPGVLLALAAGTTVNFVLIGGALNRIGDQAEEGQAARTRQIAVAPVGCKQAQDAYMRGVITRADLERYGRGAVVPCPIPAKPAVP